MTTQWEQDEHCAQLLWSAHNGDTDALTRPHQDLHDAARTLHRRFQDLRRGGGGLGVNRAKVSGDGLVLDACALQRVERALAHLASNRIWTLHRAVKDESEPSPPADSIHALLERFPSLRDDSLKTVSETWLAPAYARGHCLAPDGHACRALPAALQLRVGAADPEEEEDFLAYLEFVHAVAQRWLVGAHRGSCHALDFVSIQEVAHRMWGGRAAREVDYARQLVDAQLLQAVRLDAEYEDIVLSVAVPPYLRIHVSPSDAAGPPATDVSWIAEKRGGAHPVHFQLPRQPCPRLRVWARVEDDNLCVQGMEPCTTSPPIHEPYSLAVLGVALGAGAAAAQAATVALPCTLPPHATVLGTVVAMCCGVAAGLWAGGGAVAHLRARRAWRLHGAWQEDADTMEGTTAPDGGTPAPRRKGKSL